MNTIPDHAKLDKEDDDSSPDGRTDSVQGLEAPLTRYGVGYLFPIVTTIILSAMLTLPLILTNYFVTVTPFTEGQFQGDPIAPAILNAVYFLVIALVGGFIFVYLIRKNKQLLVRIVFLGALWISSATLLLLFADALATLYSIPSSWPLYISVVTACILTGALLTHAAIHFPIGSFARNLAIIVFGALIGAFLGLNMPTWTLLAILVALSAYDIYGVFKGPIKEIAESSLPSNDVNEKAEQNEVIPLLTYASKH
ncbi:MAG: hypothetical protein ACTSVM_07410, partial [Candidatus Ranarchaeia archaeon]